MIRQLGVDEKSNWNQFVSENKYGQIGHLFEWGEVLHSTFGYPVIRLASFEQNKIVGLCQLAFQKSLLFGRNLISIPYLSLSGILATHTAVQKELFREIVKIGSEYQAQFIEFRHFSKDMAEIPYRDHKVTFILNLPSKSDILWKGLKDKVRNQIRKAEKENLEFRELSHSETPQFYHLYSLNMRNLGSPVFSYKLFENVQKILSDHFLIYGLFYEKELVAAALTLTYKNKMKVPWAASNRKFYTKNTNIFLYWNILKTACEKQIDSFDFGRCSRTSGTYHFKKQWGGEEHPLFWYYWAENEKNIPQVTNVQSHSRVLLGSLWKKLPLSFANKLGPVLSKNIPV